MTLTWKNRETPIAAAPALSGVFHAQHPNSEKTIKRRQRLDIQPFFYALTACRDDFDQVLERINPYMNPDTYTACLTPVRALSVAIQHAGYTQTGIPLWVPEHRLPDQDVLCVAALAEGCLPLLKTQHDFLQEKAKSDGSNAVKSLADFTARYAAFQTAIEGLRDLVDLRAYQATRHATAPIPELCALD